MAAGRMFRSEVRERKEVDWEASSMRREPVKCAPEGFTYRRDRCSCRRQMNGTGSPDGCLGESRGDGWEWCPSLQATKRRGSAQKRRWRQCRGTVAW